MKNDQINQTYEMGFKAGLGGESIGKYSGMLSQASKAANNAFKRGLLDGTRQRAKEVKENGKKN